MEFILIALVAAGAAMLTFFSGFGLGTILMPVFALFFPIEIAIALTAIVHLTNNLFKITLIWRSIDKKVFLLFALPAIVAAFLGAIILDVISREIVIFSYSLFGNYLEVTFLRLIISFLLIIFAWIEIDSRYEKFSLGRKYLPLGGILSGFFGGLSGHQGALRSMFLLRVGLNKEGFVATGIAAAVVIDIARLSAYGTSFFNDYIATIDQRSLLILLTAIVFAFAGSLAGRILLRKITMRIVQLIVGYMILILGILLGAGII
ncbi:MAG: TSUP family transporter [Bacteroidales bacterium]